MANAELNLDSIGSMKKVEYQKLFQKTMTWKKAKAVIVLADFKLTGKKTTVAIPFKKPADMVKAFKELKKNKMHPLKKVAAGGFGLAAGGEDGNLAANIEIQKGGMSIEKLLEKAGPEFLGIGIAIQASGNPEAVEDTDEEDESESSTADTLSDADAAKNINNMATIGAVMVKKINDFKNDLLPRYKSGELEEKDAIEMEEMKKSFQNFNAAYEQANADDKNRLAQIAETIPKVSAQLDKMLGALDGSNPEAQKEMNLSELTTAAKDIEKSSKKLKKTVLKNLKKGKTEERDLDTVEELLQKIENFDEVYQTADKGIQEKLSKHSDSISKQMSPQLKQLKDKVIEALPGKADELAAQKALELRLQEIEQLIALEEKNIAETEKELAAQPKETIPQGEALLEILD